MYQRNLLLNFHYS